MYLLIKKKDKRFALMHLTFSLLNGIRTRLFCGVNNRNTETQQVDFYSKNKKKRLDPLISFTTECNSNSLVLCGKQ